MCGLSVCARVCGRVYFLFVYVSVARVYVCDGWFVCGVWLCGCVVGGVVGGV